MRSVLLGFLLIAGAGLTSCQKEEVSPQKSTAELLLGRWELVKSSGGIAGGTYPADPARKQEIIFDASGQATFLLNGTATHTATYALNQGPSYITGKTQTFVTYGLNGSSRQFLAELSASTLSISDDYADGMTATYQRR